MSVQPKAVARAPVEFWERVKDIQAALKDLDRLVKALRLHPPTNSSVQNLLDDVSKALAAPVERAGTLVLAVDGDRLLIGDDPIFQSDGADGLCRLLVAGNARSLAIEAGFDRLEVLHLAAALARIAGGDEKDCDLATLLWFRSVEHLKAAVDPGRPPAALAEGPGTTEVLAALAARARVEPGAAPPPPDGRPAGEGPTDPLVEFPRESERRRLESWVRRNRGFDGLVDLARGIVGAAGRNGSLPSEDGTILERLLERIIAAGDFAGALGIREALEGLATALEPADREAARLLRGVVASLGSSRNIEAIQTHLQLCDEARSEEAIRFLARLDPPARDRVLGMLGKTRFDRAICGALARICRGDIVPFVEHLDSKSPRTAAAAVHALGESGNPAAVRHLLRAVTHADHTVRAEAARALGRFQGAEAKQGLAGALLDPDRNVRRAAGTVFRESADPEDLRHIGAIVERLGGREPEWLDGEDKLEILRILAARGGPGAEDLLIGLLPARTFFGNRKRNGVRAVAARVLGERKCKKAAEHLKRLINDRDPDVRSSVRTALTALEER